MSHPHVEMQIDLSLDGELAEDETALLEAHLAECAACRRFREARLALRSAIVTAMPRLEVPDRLRARVRADLRTSGRRMPVWRQVALAATLVLVASASALGGWRVGTAHMASTVLADEVLASHVRSLMPGHLSDVTSTDQHTVKPWFDGRLDFSPPVTDFSGRGYPLLGGRLDYVGGRPVAALVYGRRKHVINVFVWPAEKAKSLSAPTTRQGYRVLHWQTPEYSYWVASDLGLSELTDFVRLLQLGDSAVAAPNP